LIVTSTAERVKMRSKGELLVQGDTKVTDHRREDKMRKGGGKGSRI
jgi:hypothetical protein